MYKTALVMIIGILGCSKAFAATELQLQQKRVMQFCANASLPLLVAVQRTRIRLTTGDQKKKDWQS